MTLKKYSAALFDMDGLLLDTELVINGCLRDTAEHYKLTDLEAVFLDMVGLRVEKSREVLNQGLAGRVDLDDFHDHASALARKRLSGPVPVPVKTDVERLLKRLHEMNIPCAVASSTRTEIVIEQLTGSGLANYFRTFTGGDQVVNPKPDPEIYIKAASTLGVEVGNCVAFEDSPHGTLAALNSGAKTVQVPDLVEPDKEFRERGQVISESVKRVSVSHLFYKNNCEYVLRLFFKPYTLKAQHSVTVRKWNQ